MKASVVTLFLATAVGYPNVTHTFTVESVVDWCIHQYPNLSSETYACSKATTSISFFEIGNYYAIDVSAIFDGPGYYEMKNSASNIVSWNPSTWTVDVQVYRCAHSGWHSVDGEHRFYIVPGAGPAGPASTFDTSLRPYCDCGTEIP